MPKTQITKPKYTTEEINQRRQMWLECMMTDANYCHFFTVSVADDTLPIGHRPSEDSEYLYSLGDAEKLKQELSKQHPNTPYIITSGSIHTEALDGIHNKWSALHKARISNLLACWGAA